MKALDLQKLKLERMRVSTAKAEMEYRIAEREDEIARLKEHMGVQDNKMAELDKMIQDAEKETN